MDFKMADLSYRILNGVIRKLDPQNLYLDTNIMSLSQIIREILAKIEIHSNEGPLPWKRWILDPVGTKYFRGNS